MKLHHLIAPTLAALGIGFWLNGQETSMTQIKERTRLLEERISLVTRTDSSSNPPTETTRQEPSFVLPDGTLNWEILAGFLTDPHDPTKIFPNQKVLQSMRETLGGLSETQLESAYTEIQHLDLSDELRELFQSSLRHNLSRTDPEAALNLLGDSPIPYDDSRFYERRSSFINLAKKDPQKAALWLDRQIANGSLSTTLLDPLKNPRFDLEAALLGQLLTSDPDTLKDRLANFDAAERERLFDNPKFWKSEGKIPDDFLQLVRESLDEEKSTKIIASTWDQGFVETARALKEMPFTENERSAIVNQTMESYLEGDSRHDRYPRAYAWLKENAPSQAVSSISRSLLHSAKSGSSIKEAFKKSLELSTSLDDPEIATGFVREFSAHVPDAMNGPVDAFEDPELAEKMREIFRTLPESSE